ncbi:MAG: hypothetical protein HWN65_07635 [Candidatus Helarchaeota archaeon]|nr:hypothetical protein [Candidatus Helarchaeota archaeon]
MEYFWFKVTKRGRSKVFEEPTDRQKEDKIENALVLFISIEKRDETNPIFIEKSIIEIEKISNQLKVSNIVILPFAHLFGELSSPQFGLNSLKEISSILQLKGYTTIRLPFGWFHELEMKAKGHPLSRISRSI